MIHRDSTLHETLGEAIAQLDTFLEGQPSEIGEELFSAMRLVVHARDETIRRVRSGGSAEMSALLVHLNSALSMLASGELPVVGIRLSRIRQGRDALARLIG